MFWYKIIVDVILIWQMPMWLATQWLAMQHSEFVNYFQMSSEITKYSQSQTKGNNTEISACPYQSCDPSALLAHLTTTAVAVTSDK